MSEKIDPYFEHRLQTGKAHRVLRSIEVRSPELETESNKELLNPVVEGSIEEFGWSEKSVENIIDALENGKIKIVFLEGDHIRIEFCPIEQMPEQLGHVSELGTIKKNLEAGQIFGSAEPDQYTYLQTADFAVEGYMDDESEGKEYGRVYVDSSKLSNKRNIYLDPESLHITDYEYGFSFCVRGGVPVEAISRIDVIRAIKLPHAERNIYINTEDSPDSPEQHMTQQVERLKEYLRVKLHGAD